MLETPACTLAASAAAATPANFVSCLALQERCKRVVEAFDAALLCHHDMGAGEEQQQQVLVTKAHLDAELSRIAAAAVQQVRAAAAAAAARQQAGAGGMSKQLEHTAAESALQAFKAQLQQLEDDCTDAQAAQQACKVRPLAQTRASVLESRPRAVTSNVTAFLCIGVHTWLGAEVSNFQLCYPATPLRTQEAVTQHLTVFKQEAGLAGSASSGAARASVTNPAALLFKGQLEAHAQQVLGVVKHRAAALNCEMKHASAAAVAIQQYKALRAAAASGHRSALMQQAHAQRAERVESDCNQLVEAAARAVQLMQQQVAQLEDKHSWQNAFVAGKLVQVAGGHCTRVCSIKCSGPAWLCSHMWVSSNTWGLSVFLPACLWCVSPMAGGRLQGTSRVCEVGWSPAQLCT